MNYVCLVAWHDTSGAMMVGSGQVEPVEVADAEKSVEQPAQPTETISDANAKMDHEPHSDVSPGTTAGPDPQAQAQSSLLLALLPNAIVNCRGCVCKLQLQQLQHHQPNAMQTKLSGDFRMTIFHSMLYN